MTGGGGLVAAAPMTTAFCKKIHSKIHLIVVLKKNAHIEIFAI